MVTETRRSTRLDSAPGGSYFHGKGDPSRGFVGYTLLLGPWGQIPVLLRPAEKCELQGIAQLMEPLSSTQF